MANRPLTLAIIGCGMMGTIRARVAARNAAVGSIRLFDVASEKAGALARLVGGTACSSAEEALDGADAAIVSTRPSAHHGLAMQAVASTAAVLVEKPFTKDLGQAREVVAAADERSVGVFAAYSQRFRGKFLGAKQQIEAGSIGDLTGGLVTFYTTKGRAKGRLARERESSPTANNFPHVADLVLWFTEGVAPVRVTTVASRGRLADLDNVMLTAWATLEFENGAIVMTGTSWELPPQYPAYHASLQADLFGTRGVIRIDDTHRDFIVSSEAPVAGLYAPDTPNLSVQHVFMGTFPPGGEAFDQFWGCARDETEAFLECARDGRREHPVLPNGAQAAEVRRLIEAVERSLAQGAPVDL